MPSNWRVSNSINYGVISTALYIDLNAAAYGTIDLGANPHPRDVVTNYDTLPLAAREETGKFGLGDIDFSEDETRLYAVNLFQKELLVIPVGTGLVPTVPANDAAIQRISIPRPTSCANADDFRPFAIGINDGTVYVGAVCTAQNVAPIANQLDATRRAAMRGYILALNAAGTAISATPLLEFPLNYNRQFSNDGAGFVDSGNWLPWIDAPAYPGGNYGSAAFYSNPQAILSDLAFDNFGFLTIALSDRLNFQVFDAEARYAGEMLLACENGSGGFNLESNGSCTARGVTRTSLDPTANGTAPDDNLASGPGGREFYFGERYNYTLSTPATDSAMNGPDYHRESASGALAILGGQGAVVTTSYDIGDTFNNGVRVMNQGNLPVTNTGLMYRAGGYMPAPDSNTLNDQFHEYRLVEGNTSFGKGNGLGDIEVLCESMQPIQIGNLVFLDADSDGVQDAGEAGIAGITIELHNAAGTVIGRTTTDANGNYAFSVREIDSGADAVLTDGDVQLLFAALYSQNVFVAIPGTTTTGLGAGGAGNISALLRATQINVNSGTLSDNRDSEGATVTPGAGAVRVAAAITLPANAGASNFSVDFGFDAAYDFGDLPDSGAGVGAGNYETLLANGGAQNLVVSTLRLGVAVDTEQNGVATALATGDNAALNNDEDGVTPTNRVRDGVGNAPTLTLNVTNTSGAVANLCAYADLNNDGAFSAAETFTGTVANGIVAQNVAATFTGTIAPGQAFANNRLYVRTRLQANACNPTGLGGIGEVEDIAIPVSATTATISAIGAFCPGQSVTFTITYSNTAGFETANAFPVTSDLIGSDEPALAGAPQFATANWAVTSASAGASAAITNGTGDINTTLTIPAAGSLVITVQGTIANAVNTARNVSANISPAIAAVDSTASNDASAATSTLNPTCTGTPNGAGALCPNLSATGTGALNPQPFDCSAASEQVVNTYYPSAGAAAQGAICLQVGTPTAGTAIGVGDVLLVVQMQGATITSTNSNVYGDNAANSPGGATAAAAGTFEYVIAQSTVGPGVGLCSAVSGNVVQISGARSTGAGASGLINAYTHLPTSTATTQRQTFQVARVPVNTTIGFSNASCSIGAPAWNGSTGGIVALDATQTINLGATAVTRINANGDGFRGGVCATQVNDNTAQVFAAAADLAGYGKGEGYAGSPEAVQPGAGGYTTTGDFGTGAPGNAGGSGQRCDIETRTGGGGG